MRSVAAIVCLLLLTGCNKTLSPQEMEAGVQECHKHHLKAADSIDMFFNQYVFCYMEGG